LQKSTLQGFEAKLVLHPQGEALLKMSIEEARRAGYLQSRKIRVALDTAPILGKGAVKDTYNLLAEGIEQLAGRLAEGEGESGAAWAERQGLIRYFGSCPAGETTNEYRSAGEGRGGRFVFAAATCEACPLRSQCVRGKGSRTLAIQAEEGLQQRAREHNQTEAGRQSLRQRVVVEHRIARLVQLGVRHSRYLGRTKTRLQVVMAAVVANVSLVLGY